MKAIQTEYNGYKFRSRLEARWAIFFDSLPIKYEYEPEGYELKDGTRYLPDFYLPDISSFGVKTELDEDCNINYISKCRDMFIEVKPPVDNISMKWKKFSKESDVPIMVVGNILNPYDDLWDQYYHSSYSGSFYWPHMGGLTDGPYMFCQCEYCGNFGIEFDGRSARIGCCNKGNHKNYNHSSPKIRQAMKMARMARFGNK